MHVKSHRADRRVFEKSFGCMIRAIHKFSCFSENTGSFLHPGRTAFAFKSLRFSTPCIPAFPIEAGPGIPAKTNKGT